jgi:pilus assembly protein CpaB
MVARRLVLALFAALTISGLFTFWLSRKVSHPHVAPVVKNQIVATAATVEAGELLKPGSLKLIDWPAGTPLDGAFVKPDDLVGRVVLFPLAAGEPVLERQLSARGSGSGLTVKSPDGMRAISLKSNEVVGVAGFLLPGTHVDVIVTYRRDNGQDSVTNTILQNVEVLAAGQKIQPDPEGKASTVDVVTLLVTPKDAERAVLADSLGSIHFVLRNGSDRERIEGTPIEMAQLGGTSLPQPRAQRVIVHGSATTPTQSAYTVETVMGNKPSQQIFK